MEAGGAQSQRYNYNYDYNPCSVITSVIQVFVFDITYGVGKQTSDIFYLVLVIIIL